ncbi:MFS transporter [Marinobacterium nitratireducens]|uniref:MFS transporter n=1 Tax=Marinobacterium nitratireducens TaxID=518897 RepID=A0A918DVD8_9GAMM|nr:MFS transporter [Marinobacterium nitratireducens]GGO85839.1 MFS transporter [Marinobacterium nitratireducens]
MFATARTLTALFSSYGLLLLANGLFTTLTSLRSKLEGFSVEVLGLLMACYFLGMFVGARFAPKQIERAGHIRAFAAFASVLSMSPLIHMLWIDPRVWAVLRYVDGYCLAGLFIVTESWLNARATNETRGSILALYMVVNYLAYGIGQLLLRFSDPGHFDLFAMASIAFSLSLVPLLLTRSQAPAPEPMSRLRIKPLLETAPAGFWGAICAGAINSAFFAMAPIFAQDLGLSVQQISIFMMCGIFGGLFLQIPIGRLSDRIERRRVLAAVSFGTLLLSLAMIELSRLSLPNYWLYGTVFAYGSLAFVIYSLSSAHVNDWSDPNQLMQTSSGLLVGYGSGAIAGPLISGALMGQFGPGALFAYTGVCVFLLMLFAIYQSVVAGQAREKVAFVPQPAAQFPAEELFHAAQDAAEPVTETPSDTTKAPPAQQGQAAG